MSKGRAGLPSLVFVLAVAMVFAGCGGGDGVPPVGPNTGAITGQVMSPAGDALGGITVSAGGVSTTTSVDGRFRLNGVPVGQHILDAQADPARNLRVWGTAADRTVSVTAGQVTDVGTVLMTEPLSIPDPPM